MTPRLNHAERTSRWYGERVRRFGYGFRSLGFNQRALQLRRFDALCEVGDLWGRRILDVGCGLGDLLEYARERRLAVDYTGLDVCPEMIERCRARFSGQGSEAGRFEVADALDYEPAEPFDFVLASGIFGLRLDHSEERIAPTLERLFSMCTYGLAVNFLSRRAGRRENGKLHVSPHWALSLALQLTPAVRLNHNYLPDDFTLYLHRTPAWRETPARRS